MTPTPFVAWTDALGRPGYLHGTKARLHAGDLLEPGRASNFGVATPSAFVYFTGTLDAATWGAELAQGEGDGHIYIVEPTGPFEDDPNLTNQRFAGNPTQSFRSRAPPARSRRAPPLDRPRPRPGAGHARRHRPPPGRGQGPPARGSP